MKKLATLVAGILMLGTTAVATNLDLDNNQTVFRTGTAGGVQKSDGTIHKGAIGIDYNDGSIYMQTDRNSESVFGRNEDEVDGRQKIGQFATVDTIGKEVTDALDDRLTIVEDKFGEIVEMKHYEGNVEITDDGVLSKNGTETIDLATQEELNNTTAIASGAAGVASSAQSKATEASKIADIANKNADLALDKVDSALSQSAENTSLISSNAEKQLEVDSNQSVLIAENKDKVSRVNSKVIGNTAEIEVIRDEMDNISVKKNGDGSSARIMDDEGSYIDVADSSVTSKNREIINKHQERLNKHDEEISESRTNISKNTEDITKESEIRAIIDNNLAKGIDSNTVLINEETQSRINGDNGVREEFAQADKSIIERQETVDNAQNQALRNESIERTQTDRRHDNEIMNNSRRIGQLDSKIDGVETQMSKGVAMAIATAHAIPMNLEKGDVGIGAGYGNFNGSSSISIGVGVRPTQNVNVNVTLGASQGSNVEYSVGAGASYKFHMFD